MSSKTIASTPAHTVAAWRKATRWREEYGGEIFPTQSSLDWFVRQHYAELVDSGTLIPGTGRRGHLVGPDFDGVVIKILRRDAGGAS